MLPSILLIDDDEEILDFLKDELQEKYSIHTALNGISAMEMLKHETVQLIVSDVMMPQMDGFELCRLIKTNIDHCHIPVILLTARNTLQSKIEGLEIGADAYIEKPFSPAHLQAQIASLLNNRSRVKEYFANSPLAHINSIAHSKSDEAFLEQLHSIILQYLEDTMLDVEKLAAAMNMSRPTLYRKIKGISNLTPHELINITRLKKAAELLAEGRYRIAEIADMAGFQSQNNFGRNFLKQFGMTPTQYIHMKQAE
ncbi:two-component system response regulator [Terrimonas sp.]|uniref:response regulator transcription factor n=1 Tax=Terrimonas sp. TaxID=1914338 RepID=UPI000D51CBD6|nr:response regulator [Terrimonas sp.]PVD49887.1 two-component system response regulator [Terrimonas sp.]